MGSLVCSEVVHDTAHHPFSSARPDSASSHARRLSNDSAFRRPSSSHRPDSRSQRPSSSSASAASASPSYANEQLAPRSHTASASTSTQARRTPSHEMSDQRRAPAASSSSPSSEPASPSLRPTGEPSPSQIQPVDGENATQSGPRGSISAASPVSNKIKVKDLQHIASCVNEETGGLSLGTDSSDGENDPEEAQYEISSMPISDVIEMVAGLLTKITSTNDRQHEHLHRSIPPLDGGGPLPSQTSSVLSFHGKNVPSITIMSYLGRIHKYCPTTYDVFISLLVYFDRMTERVNAGPLQTLRRSRERLADKPRTLEQARQRNTSYGEASTSSLRNQPSGTNTPPSSAHATPEQKFTDGRTGSTSQELPSPPLSDSDPYSLTNFFVVDSFNIHRLIIAGVTCASKFFSDIFYTNSRYAKVGGLPLAELNHLEIQFLILNEFRLSVPAEELEAYGTMLVKFYAREVLANRQSEAMDDESSG